MAMLPFRPTPFFKDKNRAFWRLQLIGWGGAMLLRAMTSIANEKPISFLVLVLIATVTGFSVSTILSVIYNKLIHQRPLVTWGATAFVLGLAVWVSAFINGWTISLYQSNSSTSFAQLVIGVFYIDMTLLGAWSALYYAINFFLQVEEQADRLERLETQATSAQLAMLRYQLNPHFLFNTLNSISTLVLLKQTEAANAMLTRLSAFLRHTLVTEPGGKVTVAQEVETLKLYLEIERMRFEERLRTDFQIDPAAINACLPSMLLQPLVENAIKYAVSPQEEGARISIAARPIGQRLRVTVSDTGPGLQNRPQGAHLPAAIAGGDNTVSTGVGLANIRDRLAQAYGEDHLFEIRTPPEGGFTVIIELPFEEAEQDTPSPVSAKPKATPSVTTMPETTGLGI
ncbi:sensor histidine kinase [Altericroceibacterium spongiae]|uniref:Sensor histidine kinase n=1 Tax=Altericroceibacterium spongiae TaxID=2320269 RepID=A0A420EPY8_9SPHN|nr:histidine kinase [Altericroceibacterium spongiae]RKF22742.1 sensor histidine kinase [Altericroceibacterium spongiae]